jgi:hypothetical protein
MRSTTDFFTEVCCRLSFLRILATHGAIVAADSLPSAVRTDYALWALPILEVLDWTGFPVGKALVEATVATGESLQLLRVTFPATCRQLKFIAFCTICAEKEDGEISTRGAFIRCQGKSGVNEEFTRVMTSSFGRECDTGWLPPGASRRGLPPPQYRQSCAPLSECDHGPER